MAVAEKTRCGKVACERVQSALLHRYEKFPRLEMIAMRWKILSAPLILPEMMGESFKEMRKKISESAIHSQHSVQRTLIAFDEGAV
jgi:hypothetical protein